MEEGALDAWTEAIGMNMAQRIDLAIRTRDFAAKTFPQDVWREQMLQLCSMLLARPMTAPAARAAA
jgi:hypothetical protein